MGEKLLTSVIDVPRRAGQSDLFGIDKYKTALVKFIETTSTPITVAIQGEWGSGKTSLMNTLKDELCDQDGKKFYPIWLNTWQFSLMKSEEETLISIINGLTNEIADIAKAKDSSLEKLAKKSLGILGKIAGASAKVAVRATTGQDVGEVVDALGGDARDTTILKLRDSLNKLISEVIKQSDKDGFLFFIDDLDRIDPPVAVNILELLKNIFDLDDCVFILAIDYDVVVKGLEPKFGKLTNKNEREFRSFFDKIIQLPFSMPVASYNIDVFLKSTLEGIGYIPQEENSKKFYENITEIAYNSVGSNPRSLKRLINTLSLISIINAETGLDKDQSDIDKQVNFALVCLQVAYPAIYKAVNEDPDFRGWNDDTATKLKLRKLEDHEIEKLSHSEEFDEEWERVLYRICERDTYLERRAFNISALLNKISELAADESQGSLGDYIGILLELSSVTDVQAFDKPRVISNRTEAAGNILQNFYELVPKKVKDPVLDIALPSLKVNLNRGLWCRCIIKDVDNKPGMGILISPKGTTNTIKIRADVPLNYSRGIDDLPSLFDEISKDNTPFLESIDKDLGILCNEYGYQIKEYAVKNARVARNKKWISSKFSIIKTYNSIEEFDNIQEHERIVEVMVEIARIIANINYCVYDIYGVTNEYKSIY
jgi:DNA-binding ferritin-like protein (Dps family)